MCGDMVFLDSSLILHDSIGIVPTVFESLNGLFDIGVDPLRRGISSAQGSPEISLFRQRCFGGLPSWLDAGQFANKLPRRLSRLSCRRAA
jgi:hypothetical protein